MNAASPALRELIDLGREGREALPPSLPDTAAWKAFDRGSDNWLTVAEALSVEELEHLIRGLVLYQRASGQDFGRLNSPLTWLFRVFRMIHREREAALGRWIVEHRTSPYEPFGELDEEGSNTFAEHRARQLQRIRAGLGG